MTSKGRALQSTITQADKTQANLSMLRVNERLNRLRADICEDKKLIVWVGDVHLHQECYEGVELPEHYRNLVSTERQLRLALYEISLLDPKPDVLILGGDLVEYGIQGEYERLFRILEDLPDIPHYYLNGNHEHSEGKLPRDFKEMYQRNKRDYWPDLAADDGLYYSFEYLNLKFICIDRLVDKPGAKLDRAQFEWLKRELEESRDLPTIICSHRSLLPVGNWIDDKFPDVELWRLIDSFPQVKAVLSGHNHTHNLWRYRDKLHVVFPATSYSVGTLTGWGGLLIGAGEVENVFVKELTGPSFNSIYPTQLQKQEGSIHLLEERNFEESPIFNPETWPRTTT